MCRISASHTVVEGPLSTSISLNYNSSGIKVDELASWVGLGWSMTAQGMISRSVQGKEDENGFLSNPGIHSIFNTGACATNPNCVDGPAPCPCTQTMAYLLDGTKDAEPDIFSFSFGDTVANLFSVQTNKFIYYRSRILKSLIIMKTILINGWLLRPMGLNIILAKH